MTIKKDNHVILKNEQPIAWFRAFWVGMLGALAMMSILDIFSMLGQTPFTFESYLGALLYPGAYGPRSWIAGFAASVLMGGVFGLLYGYFFEYQFLRANARNGVLAGLIHTAFAAFAFFPFFNIAHEELHTGMFAHFGILGSGLNPGTPLLLLVGHLLFGATMGTLYGSTRNARLRERSFEPGELADAA